MQLSRYIKRYSYKEKPEYILLFSTKRASTVLIPESMLKSIDDGSLESSEADTLSGLGFLVPDVNEEKKEMPELINETDKKRYFNAIIVLNLDCNLACKYCYEGKMKGKHYMSSETADHLIDFAETYLAEGKSINIDFYGGEPLLSFAMIRYISGRLKESAEEKGLKFTFGLITNGTLLTKNRAMELLSYGLEDAKVTIDGLKENHDIHRPFKSGAGSFDVIVRNVKDVCELIKVQLGSNYTPENYKTFPGLLDYLLKEGVTPDKFSGVKFDPVTKVVEEYALPDFRDGSESINEPWLIEAGIYLREEILKRGFNTTRIAPSPCAIEFKNDIIVNYDGTFYKCPGFIGWKGLEVGNLKTGIKDYRQSHNLDLWKTDNCLECEYLPLCFGGCRFMKMLKDGNMDDVDCRKQYLDATLETFIKQDLMYRPKTKNH